jgi:hypothetical protein
LIKLGLLKVQFFVEFMARQCLIQGDDLVTMKVLQGLHGLVVEETARVCLYWNPFDPGDCVFKVRDEFTAYGPQAVPALIVVKFSYGQSYHYVA